MHPGIAAWVSELTRRNLLVTVMVVLVVSISSVWSFVNVQQEVRNARSVLLNSVLNAQVEALAIWVGENKFGTAQLAAEPTVVTLTTQLIRNRQSGDVREPGPGGDVEAFRRQMLPVSGNLGLAAASIVATDGTLVASLAPENVGSKLAPAFLSRLKDAIDEGTVFIGPTREADRLPAVAAEKGGVSLVWTAAPIVSGESGVLAVLCLGRRVTGQIARIVGSARPGNTGETFAFDRNGGLLTSSRHESHLRGFGVPGVDAETPPGAPPATPNESDPAGRVRVPLTALVADAVAWTNSTRAGTQGTILKPYRNYAGTPVIGAWRWLPALGLGIAVEIAETEAYAPIAFVAADLGVLLLALAVAVFLGPLVPPLLWKRFSALKEGDRVEKYRLSRRIGEGGQADVYEALDRELGRMIAIKIMKGRLREEWEQRFRRERRLLAALDHTGVVSVLDSGSCDDGRPFYVMELVPGRPLSEVVIEDGPLESRQARQVLRKICESVQHLHDNGIIHRDLKPENVLFRVVAGGASETKLIDFGLAKSAVDAERTHLTQEVNLLGTLGYMAPERIKDPGDLDVRGDVYSIGAIGYFLVTGKEIIPDLGNLDAPPACAGPELALVGDDHLADVISKAMAIHKPDRWRSCTAMCEALGRDSRGEPQVPSPVDTVPWKRPEGPNNGSSAMWPRPNP